MHEAMDESKGWTGARQQLLVSVAMATGLLGIRFQK